MNITFLADIAGRVTRDIRNADRVTVGGVVVPYGAMKFVRKRIPANLPKWRDANETDVELVIDLIVREALSVSAVSVEKEEVTWEAFWRDAADAHSRTAQVSGGKIGFMKAAMVIKCALFGQISALGVAHAILEKQIPIASSLRRPYFIRESMIFDTEIEGNDNVEVFRELWEARNAHQPLSNILGINRHATSVALTTEQDEPLLLLPDYVAGLAHAVKSNAGVLSASKISDKVAQRLYERLRRSRKYAEVAEPFSYRYHDVFPTLMDASIDAP